MAQYYAQPQPHPNYSTSPSPSYSQQSQPPPSYSTSPNPTYNHQPQPYPNYSTSPNPSYNQQPQPQPLPGYSTSPNPSYNQAPSGPRILHIYHEGLTGRKSTILDSDKQTPLYHISISNGLHFSGKPHVTITSARTGAPISTITFHTLSSNIDLSIHSQPITLSKSSWMSSTTHEYRSPATGSTLKWKRDSAWHLNNDLLCVDQNERLWARFLSATWAMKKEGKIELGEGVRGALMDEIVTSGVAMVALLKMQQGIGTAGAAGGAAGASC